jgi:hypothetical protein
MIGSLVNQKLQCLPNVTTDTKRPRTGARRNQYIDRYVLSGTLGLRKHSYSASELLQVAKVITTTGYTTCLIQEAVRPQALVRSEASDTKYCSTYQASGPNRTDKDY